MGQTKEQRIIRQLSGVPTTQKFTPIATGMFLPNHSGDHSRGIVNATPTTDTDIPNKKYVDDAIAAMPVPAHTIASHSDTTGTGAELNTLTDDSMADTLHRHSELSASDGTPNPALSIDATGNATMAAGLVFNTDHINSTTAAHGIVADDDIFIAGGKALTTDHIWETTGAHGVTFTSIINADAGFKDIYRAYFQAYRTATLDLTTANTWYVIPFNVAATLKVGFTHAEGGANPEHITVTEAGIYQIYARLQAANGDNSNYQMRIMNGANEIAGSFANQTEAYRGHLDSCVIVSLAAGAVIEVQATSSGAGHDIVYYDSGGDPTTWVSASINIHRICPV